LATLVQVPAGAVQALHVPQVAALQHTPSTQLPLMQTAFDPHDCPLALRQLPEPLHAEPAVLQVSESWAPEATNAHVPLGAAQSWQVPQLEDAQHTPLTHWFEMHWVFDVHGEPFD
jgi:hypothetical protein